MSVLLEDSAIYTAARALCAAMIEDEQVLKLKGDIDTFLTDGEARSLFDCVNKMGQELTEKHQAGMEPSEEEITQFDSLRQNVITNSVCHNFLQARQQIDAIFSEVNRYFGLALELNRVPSHEELEAAMTPQAGGCCGGGCGEDGECKDGNCNKEDGCDCKH